MNKKRHTEMGMGCLVTFFVDPHQEYLLCPVEDIIGWPFARPGHGMVASWELRSVPGRAERPERTPGGRLVGGSLSWDLGDLPRCQHNHEHRASTPRLVPRRY